MATSKSLFEREKERERERERERETGIIILCVLTYIDLIAERACFSTIMYWSAHVGTQENGWHNVMKNAKMVALTNPLFL